MPTRMRSPAAPVVAAPRAAGRIATAAATPPARFKKVLRVWLVMSKFPLCGNPERIQLSIGQQESKPYRSTAKRLQLRVPPARVMMQLARTFDRLRVGPGKAGYRLSGGVEHFHHPTSACRIDVHYQLRSLQHNRL